MAFDAGTVIEPIGYDFTAFGGGKDATPEPTNDKMVEFWTSYAAFIRENQERVQSYQKRLNAVDKEFEKLSDEEKDERRDEFETRKSEIEREFETVQHEIQPERKKLRCEMFARVCSDKPGYDELYALPARILEAFESYLLEELSPKGLRTATTV